MAETEPIKVKISNEDWQRFGGAQPAMTDDAGVPFVSIMGVHIYPEDPVALTGEILGQLRLSAEGRDIILEALREKLEGSAPDRGLWFDQCLAPKD